MPCFRFATVNMMAFLFSTCRGYFTDRVVYPSFFGGRIRRQFLSTTVTTSYRSGTRRCPRPFHSFYRDHPTNRQTCNLSTKDSENEPALPTTTSLSRSSSLAVISSSKSQTVKKIQNLLAKRKKRQELGQTVVEGPRMVFDLLDNPVTSPLVRQILVSVDDYDDSSKQRLAYRPRLAKYGRDILVQLVEPDVFRECTDTMTTQGIVAIVDIPNSDEHFIASDEQSSLASLSSYPLYLVLDGVSDPGNLGTLLRSSLAVGVKGVVLLPGCCDVWNPKAVRSAMGASFQLPIVQGSSWREGLAFLQRNGVKRVYMATMIEDDDIDNNHPANKGQKSNMSCFNVDWLQESSALVIGSEGNGLSPAVRQALTETNSTEGDESISIAATHIPMQAGIESLNAAVCGSVILFEYSRQCQLHLGSLPS